MSMARGVGDWPPLQTNSRGSDWAQGLGLPQWFSLAMMGTGQNHSEGWAVHRPLVGNQPQEGGAAQGGTSKGGGCQLPGLPCWPKERVKPFPRQRTRKRARRQRRVRRSASGLKLPRAEGHRANGEVAFASRDRRPRSFALRSTWEDFSSSPPRPPVSFARARPRGRSRERCDCSRESEWAAWGGGGRGVAGWGGRGSAAALRLAPPGVAGRHGRVTCPGAERLCRQVSGVGSGEPAGWVQTAAGQPWPRCVGARAGGQCTLSSAAASFPGGVGALVPGAALTSDAAVMSLPGCPSIRIALSDGKMGWPNHSDSTV